MQQACDEKGIAHPDVISESGRALTAHHAILVFDVLGVSRQAIDVPPGAAEHEDSTIANMVQILKDISLKNFQESYHDALQLKEEATSLFNLGYPTSRAARSPEPVLGHLRPHPADRNTLDYVPDELQGLERALADTPATSRCSSAPDHWA